MGVNTRFKDVAIRLVKPILYTAVIATLAFGGGKLIPSARADPPKPVPAETTRRPAGPVEEQPPAGTKEAETPKAPKPLDPELAKLDKMSLGHVTASFQNTCKLYDCWTGEDQHDWQTAVQEINFPKGKMAVLATIYKVPTTRGNVIGMAYKGKAIGGSYLDELARLYEKATGNKLKYVALAVTGEEENNELGKYFGVAAIPAETPGNPVLKAGIPILSVIYVYSTGKVLSGEFILTDSVAQK